VVRDTWENVHFSHATGFQQDIHYKFLHHALYTNLQTSKFSQQTIECDYCYHVGRFAREDAFHLIFNCPLTDGMWEVMLPYPSLYDKSSYRPSAADLHGIFIMTPTLAFRQRSDWGTPCSEKVVAWISQKETVNCSGSIGFGGNFKHIRFQNLNSFWPAFTNHKFYFLLPYSH
jgi:hypothetical protein